jgi:hypothetical protein
MITSAADGKKPIVHACPGCGGPVACGMTNGEAKCWCTELPPALPVPANDGGVLCYCRSCLEKLSAAARSLRP